MASDIKYLKFEVLEGLAPRTTGPRARHEKQNQNTDNDWGEERVCLITQTKSEPLKY